MSNRTKVVALFVLLTNTSTMGLRADPAPDVTGVYVTYQGYKASRLFYHLSENLVRDTVQYEDREVRHKIGFAMGCQEVKFHASQAVEYTCTQYFFKNQKTANAQFIRGIPPVNTSQPKTFSELLLTGEDAAQVFALAAVTFPEEMETCSDVKTCEYLRIIRARDITCFERQGTDATLQYDCAQYIDNRDGSAKPGGGDPMIGVVL